LEWGFSREYPGGCGEVKELAIAPIERIALALVAAMARMKENEK
jgi:hypothetical protein